MLKTRLTDSQNVKNSISFVRKNSNSGKVVCEIISLLRMDSWYIVESDEPETRPETIKVCPLLGYNTYNLI